MCYGWSEGQNNTISCVFNSHDSTQQLEACFYAPVLHKLILESDIDENLPKWEYVYKFSHGATSLCEENELNYFCPVVLQLNKPKMNLKLIASCCSINVVTNTIESSISS